MPVDAWTLWTAAAEGAVAAYLRDMTRVTEAPAATNGSRPAWLDPRAIAAWIGKLHDYKQFWNLVEAQPDALEDRYARDGGLQSQIAEARAHPERRVPRPARRSA